MPALKLIDCSARKVIVPPTTIPFVALGYVWGPLLEDSNTEEQDQPDKVEIVVEDAIRVTLELGHSYLWVDRHCIREQDKAKMHEQLQNMNFMYQNAGITIIAAAGQDSSFGLPGASCRARLPQPYAQIKGHILTSIPPDPKCGIMDSVWTTMGMDIPRRFFFLDDVWCSRNIKSHMDVRE